MRNIFIKAVLLSAATVATSCSVHAEDYYAVRPNGDRDYTVNSLHREGATIYQVRTDGQRDWSKPTIKIEDGKAVTYRPHGQQDWTTQKVRK